MLVDVLVPDLDLPGVAVSVSMWHVRVGQRVVEGDALVEIVAGDVVVDLPAPAGGTVVERCAEVDQPLVVGQVLARIRPDANQ
jgi:pyruvate/2-oxoglutarate dehydrogenase complex dihydrolipoamide acyltransferase (E2) component